MPWLVDNFQELNFWLHIQTKIQIWLQIKNGSWAEKSCTFFETVVKFIYSEKATKFAKSPPNFWLVLLLCGWHVNRKDVTKWRNDEFWNFHATYSNVFFWSTKLSQPRQCRDSCTYYIIFQNFVISSFRHIFSIDTPTTLDWKLCNEIIWAKKFSVKLWQAACNTSQWSMTYLAWGRQGLFQTFYKVVLHTRHCCWPTTYFLPFLSLLMLSLIHISEPTRPY